MSRRLKALLAAAVLILSFAPVSTAHATGDSIDTIKKKFEVRALYNCFYQRFKKEISSAEVKSAKKIDDFLEGDSDTFVGLADRNAGQNGVNGLTCAAFLEDRIPSTNWDDVHSKQALLESLGYTSTSENPAPTATFEFKTYNPTTGEYSDDTYSTATLSLDGSLDLLGTISAGSTVTYDNGLGLNNKQAALWFTTSSSSVAVNHLNSSKAEGYGGIILYQSSAFTVDFTPGKTLWTGTNVDGQPIGLIDLIDGKLRATVSYHDVSGTRQPCTGNNCQTFPENITYMGVKMGASDPLTSYKKATNPDTAAKSIFGEGYDSKFFSTDKDDKVALGQNYLISYFGATPSYCGSTEEESKDASIGHIETSDTSVWVQTKIYQSDGSMQYCYVKENQHESEYVFWITKKPWMVAMVKDDDGDGISNFKHIAEWLMKYGPDSIDADTASTIATSTTDDDATTVADSDLCYDGAGAVGWLMCPALTAVSGALTTVYNWVEENFLQLPANDFFQREGSVYKAWALARDFANILFVLIFLVVIFSQVTGFGIDNYGIKRLLPRLIITAILVNFSWLICQLLVDVSNIAGRSIRLFFNSFTSASTELGTSGLGGVASTVSAVGNIAALAIVVEMLFADPTIILTLLVCIVSCLISVLFIWAVLIAREVGVVLAVILAPLAFCCYMLPNLNSAFKQWVNLLKGLLLVYPLASLLVGGGAFISDLLGSIQGNTAMALAAMLVRVLPYFALPTLFRRSLQAMGNLGATMGNLGRNLSRSADGAMRNSQFYKSTKAWGRGRKAEKRGAQAAAMRGSRFARIPGVGRVVQGAANLRNRAAAEDAAVWDAEQNRQIEADSLMDARMNPNMTVDDMKASLSSGNLSEAEFNARARRLSNMDGGKELAKWAAGTFGAQDFDRSSAKGQELLKRAQSYMAGDKNFSKQLAGVYKPVTSFISSAGAQGDLYVDDGHGGKVANTAAYGSLELDDLVDMNTTSIQNAVATGFISQQVARAALSPNAPDRIRQRVSGEKAAALGTVAGTAMHYADGSSITNSSGQAVFMDNAPEGFNVTGAFQDASGEVYLESGNRVIKASDGSSLDTVTAAGIRQHSQILKESSNRQKYNAETLSAMSLAAQAAKAAKKGRR